MKKRILCAILLSSMLLSAVACNGGNPEDTKSSVTDDPSASLPAGIEKKDYDNATVNIAYPNWGLYPNYFFSEENTGDAIDVALYNRELKVEEHLGVDITYEMQDDIRVIVENIRQTVMSNEDAYQIALNHCIMGLNGMVTEGLLYDLNSIDTIDITSEWWNTRSMQNLEVDGKLFCAINDYMIPDPSVVVFNKGFVDTYQLDDPYQLVREGDWTIDTMMAMMKAVTTDNGDGKWDVNDIYGLGTPENWYICPYIYSAGLLLTEKDEDGLFTLSFGTDERSTLFTEKLHALLKGPDTYVYEYFHDQPTDKGYDPEKSLNITKGRSLFGLVASSYLNAYRDTNVEFGILPYPKLDAEQEDYLSLDWSGLLIVPASVQEPEMVGEVIELLAYYSEEEVLPAYYDVVLGEKLSRDEDSKEMLEIIFDGIIFDAGVNYFGFSPNVHKIFYIGDSILKDNWSGIASFMATLEKGAEAEIETFNLLVEDLD